MPGNTSRRIYEKIIQFHILSQDYTLLITDTPATEKEIWREERNRIGFANAVVKHALPCSYSPLTPTTHDLP